MLVSFSVGLIICVSFSFFLYLFQWDSERLNFDVEN